MTPRSSTSWRCASHRCGRYETNRQESPHASQEGAPIKGASRSSQMISSPAPAPPPRPGILHQLQPPNRLPRRHQHLRRARHPPPPQRHPQDAHHPHPPGREDRPLRRPWPPLGPRKRLPIHRHKRQQPRHRQEQHRPQPLRAGGLAISPNLAFSHAWLPRLSTSWTHASNWARRESSASVKLSISVRMKSRSSFPAYAASSSRMSA